MAKLVQKLRSIMVKKPKKEIDHSKKTPTATRRSHRTKKPNKHLSHHRELLRKYYNGQKLQKKKRKTIQATKTVHFSPKIQYFYFKSEKIPRYELRASKRIPV